ncbi:MAG: hypothetical protein MIO93_09885 [ANME-2 cluster archaeon]|nr:hypothetical protein [ANME-2 cluster archaeon]
MDTPICGNYIYVRTSPTTSEKVLVTEEGVKKIDWLKKLENYGITEKHFDDQKNKLSTQFGCIASNHDVIHTLFNKLILENSDFHTLKMIYFEHALFLYEEGGDCFKNLQLVKNLQLARKMELLRYKQSGIGIEKVKIRSHEESCSFCQALNGKIYSIEEALKIMPIPCKDCTFILYRDKRNFCRCTYAPILDY